MSAYIKDVRKFWRQFSETIGIYDVFTAAAATENMSGFISSLLQSLDSVINQLTHCHHVPSFGITALDGFNLYIHIHR